MIKYAIVGNIASGKTTMGKELEKHNFVVVDSDLIAHKILTDNPIVATAFKDYDIFEDGKLSRNKLGKLVFNNKDLKTKLENLIHPLIKQKIEKAFKTYKDEKAVFVLVPLLFEVGWQQMFDKIIFVYTEDNIRLERLIKRNGYSKEYAQKRLNSQLPQETKIKKSDYVIENNGTVEEFRNNIVDFINNKLG